VTAFFADYESYDVTSHAGQYKSIAPYGDLTLVVQLPEGYSMDEDPEEGLKLRTSIRYIHQYPPNQTTQQITSLDSVPFSKDFLLDQSTSGA